MLFSKAGNKERQEMNDMCAKEGCDNPSYTKSYIILDSLIGKVSVYLCNEHLVHMLQMQKVLQLFKLEKDINK
jgi:hypothetical protein